MPTMNEPELLTGEPDYASASRWWSDLSNYWTSIGWKDHLFRFNVLHNGNLIAQPDLNRRTRQWQDEGVFLKFSSPANAHAFYGERDDLLVRQGWKEHAAPVLWSQWPYFGVMFEQQVFAHVPGGRAVQTGIEPLFAWVRFTVVDRLPALEPRVPPHERQGVAVRINQPHMAPGMTTGHNIRYNQPDARYARRLTPEYSGYHAQHGYRLLEPNGRVRLGIAGDDDVIIDFADGRPDPLDYQLDIWIEPEVGTKFDLLVPMLPASREEFDCELALGFDAALAEANVFWSYQPATAAHINIPEKPLNDLVQRCLQFASVCAEKNPADGCYSCVTGSFAYTDLWATPAALTFECFLDPLGHHETVARYLEVFKQYQGTVTPPGDWFEPHAGYLSSPKSLTSIDWLSDHGALLYTISRHLLLWGDEPARDAWLEPIVRACDFIRYARSITGHGGIEGLLPPAVATDRGTRIQGVWNDGWNYKGYTTAIRLLRQAGHSRAGEFAADAEQYRQTFQQAFRTVTEQMPVWHDTQGRAHHLTPTSLSGGDSDDETRHAFYLDTGPLFLVFAGLMRADDPLMASTRLWFREGPPQRHYRVDSSCWQVPVLRHEISSCEPCYSWIGYHSHQLGDRERFLEAMYSLFAGAQSRQTFSLCETRGGISGLTPALVAFHLARLAVVDDEIEEDALHLLRLVPLAWLQPGHEATFESMPTDFGPVSLRFVLSHDRSTLEAEFSAQFRIAPAKVLLHIPPLPALRAVRLNHVLHGITEPIRIL